MQKDKKYHKEGNKEEESPFTLYKNDLQDLCKCVDELVLNTQKLPKSLVDDFTKWSQDKAFKGFLFRNISSWFYQAKDRVVKSAIKSHNIIDNLLVEKIPHVVIQVYIQLLLKNRTEIEKQLNLKQAEEFFKYVPTDLTVDYLQLFRVKLTDKEKDDLIYELTKDRKKINDKIVRIPAIFRDKEKYCQILITKLMKMNRFQTAGALIKRYHLGVKKYPEVQIHLIQNSARSMPHWQKEKFCWQMLEQVFEPWPSAIAECIKGLFRDRKPSKQMEKGFASIVHRSPQVLQYLPNDIKNRLKQIKQVLPNKLRNDKFQPSDSKQYFSLSDFEIRQKDVIWVDQSNIEYAVSEVFKSSMIGIDTQSTVARTTLSSSKDLLSIVQIANGKAIYIFDAKILKEKPFKSAIVNDFFKNQKNSVIGHTLSADLNEDVTLLFDFNQKILCQKIDICPIFKKHYPGKRAGLAFISEEVLGKKICKQHTLTNWDRRPLYRNQLHYAALDAQIVLRIWDVLKDKQDVNAQVKKPTPKQEQEQRQVIRYLQKLETK